MAATIVEPGSRTIAPAERAPREGGVWAGLALAGAMAVTAAVLLYVGRGLSFYFDEWAFILGRRGNELSVLIEPHNEHLSAIPIVVYKVLFDVVGLEHYVVYRVAVVAVHLLCALLVFRLARSRVGDWGAVVAAAFVLFLGSAWQDVLWPFQIGFLGSVAAGLGAWRALDRGGRAGDAMASFLVLVALACGSLGIPILIGVAVELLAGVRRRPARLAVLVLPVALYGLWYLGYGESALERGNVRDTADWALDAAAAAAGGLFGQGLDWGRSLAALGGALLVWRLTVHRGSVTPRLLGLAATAASFWLLTALARADTTPPDASRYLYLGAVVIVLVACEALRDARPPGRALVAAGLVVVLAGLLNTSILLDGAGGLRSTSNVVSAELGAIELAGRSAPAGYQPDLQRIPDLRAGPYLEAVRDLATSPADTPAELASAGGEARVNADRVLQGVGSLALAPARRRVGEAEGVPPAIEGATGGVPERRGSCVRIAPARRAPVSVDLALPAAGLAVSSRGGQADVRARRFFEEFANDPVGAVGRGGGEIVARRDASPAVWHVRLSGAATITACARTP